MSTSRERLYERYSQWVTTATRDGTSEQRAKEVTLRKRMRRLYPQRGSRSRFARVVRRWQAFRDPRIILT